MSPPPPPPPPPVSSKKNKYRDDNSDYRQMYRQFKSMLQAVCTNGIYNHYLVFLASRTHALAHNVLNTKKFAVPEGYKLVHSKKGIPYLGTLINR